MIQEILSVDSSQVVIGTAIGTTGLIYFVRFVRRMFYSEKRDTAIDQASQSLFENLRLENTRMATQMEAMSLRLNSLSKENYELNKKVSDLTMNVLNLVVLEKEHKELQGKLMERDTKILALSEEIIMKDKEIIILTNKLMGALEAVKLRRNES